MKFPQEIVDVYKNYKPTHQKIYMIIRDSIFYGNIPSGEKFTEEAISKALGCSRTPVRTALTRLQNEGLLQNLTKNNIGIHEYSEKEKLDLIELDALLEGRAAYLAARNGVSGDDLDTLTEINDTIANYKDLTQNSQDLKDYGVRDLHMQFHLMIAKCSTNTFLYKEIISTRNIMRSLHSNLGHTKKHQGDFANIIAPAHEHIIDAIRNRKPEDAELYMRYEVTRAKFMYENSSLDKEYHSH